MSQSRGGPPAEGAGGGAHVGVALLHDRREGASDADLCPLGEQAGQPEELRASRWNR